MRGRAAIVSRGGGGGGGVEGCWAVDVSVGGGARGTGWLAG